VCLVPPVCFHPDGIAGVTDGLATQPCNLQLPVSCLRVWACQGDRALGRQESGAGLR